MRKTVLALLLMMTFLACMTALSFGEEAPAEDAVIFTQGDSIALAAGKTETLKVKYPKSLKKAKKTLVWTSGDEAVATVSEKGTVKAIGNGSTTVACEIQYDNGNTDTLSCRVEVYTPVTAGILETADLALGVGQSRDLVWTVEPETASNPGFDWISEDETIATVQGGRVTGVAEGKTTIKAIAADGSGATMTCRVDVTSLFVDENEITVDSQEPVEILVHYTGRFAEKYSVLSDENMISFEIITPEEDEEEEEAPAAENGEAPVPEKERTCTIRVTPLAVGESLLTIKDNEKADRMAEVHLNVTENGLCNAQKLVITRAEILPNGGNPVYRIEIKNNSSQETGEISFVVDYRDQFRDTRCQWAENGTLANYRFTTMINILPGERATVAGRIDPSVANVVTEVRLALTYYRYVESAEKVYIPDSQLYWCSSKTGIMDRPEEIRDYVNPDIDTLDKAERIQLGATSCDLYSYCAKRFARSYRPGRYIAGIGENSYAAFWGLEYGDVIYGADGRLWENDPFIVDRAFADIYDGKTVQLMVVRNGEEIEIPAGKKPKQNKVN